MAQLGDDACKSRREGNEMCEREEFFSKREGERRGRFTFRLKCLP